MVEKQKILITGISGFIGGALADELQNAGNYEISGLVGKSKRDDFTFSAAQNGIFQADVADEKTLHLADAIKTADILVHTAGLAHRFGRICKDDFWKINVKGTENICRLAHEIGVKHFILISSVAVYGASGEGKVNESFVCSPKGFYAESKYESEKLAGEFCQKNKMRLTILRLATAIGEGDLGNTTRLITAIDRGRFFWIGKGSNKKSLIYKGDAARGILKVAASEAETGAEIFNLTGETVSMRKIVGEIYRNLQKKEPRLRIPENFARSLLRLSKKGIFTESLGKIETILEKWLSDDIFSGARFNERFKFSPATPFSEAIARQVSFYLAQKNRR